jgi:hypothetical protein
MGVELMADDINIPGLGNAPKKYVIGGVLAAAGVGVIVFIRARSAAKTAAATAATADTSAGLVTDPAGNQCTAVDPNSGYCPGSPEDTAWQENNSGYYGSDLGDEESDLGEAGGTSAAGLTYVTDPAGNQCVAVDPATGYCPGTPQDIAAQGGVTGSPVAPVVSTNSDWLQAALQVLPGGDTSANEAALAGVLGGLTVTTAQKNIFLEAVGLEGQPPQGYPTPIKTSDTAAQPGTPTSAGAISNLTVTASGTSVTARWNPAKNATQGYKWDLTGPSSHSGTTKSTSATVTGLKAGTYNFGIQALPGGPGNNEHVTVK